MSPWAGILAVLLALGGAFAVLRLVERVAAPHPEVLRKLAHMGMGLVAAAFPWLFDETWPVLLLALISLVSLVLVRSGAPAVRSLRGVLHGVQRSSWGELLFPVSVALVFVLARGDPLLYSVPILILALADAVAALIGLYYGRTPFSTLEGSKSIEGSLAFFIVTFLCVHVPVLLFTEVGRAESLLIGLLMGVIVMMFEAVAWRGLDNLFVPVASFALLKTYLDVDVLGLLLRLVVILSLGAFLLFWRKRSNLDDSALVGAGLVAYGAWAIGDLYWLLVPVAVFLVAALPARDATAQDKERRHSVYALLSFAGPAMAWLVLSRNFDANQLLVPYAVALTAHLAMVGVARAHFRRKDLPLRWLLPGVLQGLAVLLLPFLLLWGPERRVLAIAAVGGVAMLLAAFAFLRLQPRLEACPVSPERWTLQAAIAAGVSILAWLGFWAGSRGAFWT